MPTYDSPNLRVPPSVVIAARLPHEVAQFVAARAAEGERSISGEIRRIVKAEYARVTNGRGARQDASPQSRGATRGHVGS
jgi:hypothetical protein